MVASAFRSSGYCMTPEMTFEYLPERECQCLEDAFNDSSLIFARRVDKTKTPKDRHFRGKHERAEPRLPDPSVTDCEQVCGYYGISVDVWNETSQEQIWERHQRILDISPKYKNNLLIFKFGERAGKVKHTPVRGVEPNLHHHDFYKCDTFDVEQDIIEVEMRPIK